MGLADVGDGGLPKRLQSYTLLSVQHLCQYTARASTPTPDSRAHAAGREPLALRSL